MRSWRIAMLAVAAVGVCALAALAVQSDDRAASRTSAYKVIPWPAHTTGQAYREQVEHLFNEMAAQGWRFHGDVAAQGARMLVFEKARR